MIAFYLVHDTFLFSIFLLFSGMSFFMKYHSKQETFYNDELTRLKSITTPEQIINNDLVETYRFSYNKIIFFKDLTTNQAKY